MKIGKTQFVQFDRQFRVQVIDSDNRLKAQIWDADRSVAERDAEVFIEAMAKLREATP